MTSILKFFGGIILEGDATNITQLWNGGDLDPNDPNLIEEEKLYINGFKHLIIWVPQKLRDAGYGKIYSKLPADKKEIAEQHCLRYLAFWLEQNGRDYPPELPRLTEENEHELCREFQHAHEMKPEEADDLYNRNKSSIFVKNCLKFIFRYFTFHLQF